MKLILANTTVISGMQFSMRLHQRHMLEQTGVHKPIKVVEWTTARINEMRCLTTSSTKPSMLDTTTSEEPLNRHLLTCGHNRRAYPVACDGSWQTVQENRKLLEVGVSM